MAEITMTADRAAETARASVIAIDGIECYEQDGTVYLSLEAVARGLGFTQTKNSVEYIRYETIDRYLSEIGFPNKLGKRSFIPENIFYRLAMKAKNEVAEAFQAKIADEVIPAIRKHGGYLTPKKLEEALLNPDVLINLATQLKAEREKTALQAKAIEVMAPKAIFADAVSASAESILVGNLAKILRQNGIDTNQNKLFAWLRENGYLMTARGTRYNLPTQYAVASGYFEIKEHTILNRDGSVKVTYTPVVTGKGQVHLINKFLGKKGTK